MSAYKLFALGYLLNKAKADKNAALASLQLLLDHPVGIGDHSTDDLYKELDNALDKLVDAEDRLATLQTHFGDADV